MGVGIVALSIRRRLRRTAGVKNSRLRRAPSRAKLGRKLTGHERSMLWSKFAPHFYIVKPPEPQRRKAAALGDRIPDCSLEVV